MVLPEYPRVIRERAGAGISPAETRIRFTHLIDLLSAERPPH
jgi:hypothetical protein